MALNVSTSKIAARSGESRRHGKDPRNQNPRDGNLIIGTRAKTSTMPAHEHYLQHSPPDNLGKKGMEEDGEGMGVRADTRVFCSLESEGGLHMLLRARYLRSPYYDLGIFGGGMSEPLRLTQEMTSRWTVLSWRLVLQPICSTGLAMPWHSFC